ncbi:hypothetical protein KKD03_01020 [Patescibacteria group bacterium]|nr:hypothetical protein [Patescibacteria group bacterium]
MSRNELKELIDDGRLDITQIISPTRTISTGLSIALAENGDGQIQEPFHHLRRQSFEEGLDIILRRAKELLSRKRDKENVHLIIKDIAKYLSDDEWEELLGLVTNIVFTVREPTQTLFSILRRRINDQVKFGSDSLSEAEVLERISLISEEKWRDESWNRISGFLSKAQERGKEKIVIISGLSLRYSPHAVLERLSKMFEWYPFNENMVDNWQVARGEKFFNPPPIYAPQEYVTGTDENGIVLTEYYRTAVTSKGFAPLNKDKDISVSLETFTEPMQNYLLDELMPIYFYFLRHELNISRPSIIELLSQIDNSQPRLDEFNPIEALILLSGFTELQGKLEFAKKDLLKKIKYVLSKKHPLILNKLEDLIEKNT